MKWSQIAHSFAGVVVVVGAIALVGAWVAGTEGTFLGFSQDHLYNDAISLLLVSTAFGVAALYHQKQELVSQKS